MDGGTVIPSAPEASALEKAEQVRRDHPVALAAWHAAGWIANLAIKAQDGIEARLRKAVEAP